tara:strand:- start:99 stop:302 length:204 start_codon:yes stop_codon:yes gene_type:complete
MDKYTKGILTVIAVGIIGLNIQMMNGGGFFGKAHAFGENIPKVRICNILGDCAGLTYDKKLEVSIKD